MLELLDPAPVLAERASELGRVVEEDVDPDPRVRSGHPRHVPERAARSGKRLVPVDPDRTGVVEKEVGERVREVARESDEPVVRARIHRDRKGAQRGDEPVQAPVALRVGLCDRRQEPGRTAEELPARMLRTVGLGSADRVTADEPRPFGDRCAHRALRRADV